MELSIIIPLYQEALTVKASLKRVLAFMDSRQLSYEVIAVDDGSSDDTLKQAKTVEHSALFIKHYAPNRGKGYAVKQGVFAAKGDYLLFMDADLSTDLEEIDHFRQLMKTDKPHVIIGNRNGRSKDAQKRPWYRMMLGRGFAALSRLILQCPYEDFTCGFKMFRREAALALFKEQRMDRWAFDSEILSLAHQWGLRVISRPVKWQHRGDSKVHIARDMFRSLRDLCQIRYNQHQGVYRKVCPLSH